jgi:5-methyltetrahydropteroyltriglutamate--homocysteine methyltransferase
MHSCGAIGMATARSGSGAAIVNLAWSAGSCANGILPPRSLSIYAAAQAASQRLSLPSPGLFVNFWCPERSQSPYASLEHFLADVVAILRDEVAELVRLGATYIQTDAPHYPLLLAPETRAFYESRGWTIDQWLSRGIELDNAVMAGFSDATFAIHLCRGNQEGGWLVEGDYEPIARPIFQRTRATRILLEYDDDRSGLFAPLRHVPDDKTVVLGLISTKRPQMEVPEDLIRRITEANRFVSLGSPGAQPSVRLCLFNRWKRPFH